MDNTKIANLLIVDDNPANLSVLLDFLRRENFGLVVAKDGEQALQRVETAQPDLILLDVMMPGISGYDVCRKLKAQPQNRSIPVIFMTALADVDNKMTGFVVGAADYITKPFQQDEVLARIYTHLNLYRLQQELEEKNRQLEQQNRTLHAVVGALEEVKRNTDEQGVARTRLMAALAQELRPPMAELVAKSEALEGDAPDGLAADLHKIADSGNELLALLNDLLELARIDATGVDLKEEPIDLPQFLRGVVEHTRPHLAAWGSRVEISCTEGIEVQGDRHLLGRLLGKLLIQAGTAARDGLVWLIVAETMPGRIDFRITDCAHAGQTPGGGSVLRMVLVDRLTALLGGELQMESAGLDHCVTLRLPKRLTPPPERNSLRKPAASTAAPNYS